MDFSIQLKSLPKELFDILTDFEEFPNIVPRQIKNVRIIKKEGSDVITEETLVFKTVIKNEIIQQCHHKIGNNSINTKILSGPAKNSIINTSLKQIDKHTQISVDIDLKLILKAKIFLPIIKKIYKNLLTGIFYKIDNLAMEKNSRGKVIG